MLKKLQNDMKEALKGGEKLRLSTIRLLLSAIKNESIDKKRELDNSEIQVVVQREVKQRRNSIEDFKRGLRDDLVKQAEEEIALLESYLPQQLSDEELEILVRRIVTELNPSPKEAGKVMGKLMPEVKGKADGTRVQAMVRKVLG